MVNRIINKEIKKENNMVSLLHEKMKIKYVLLCVSICFLGSLTAQTAPQLSENSNKEVISAMTLQEKARILVGNGMKMPSMPVKENGDKPKNKSSKEQNKTDRKPVVQGPTIGATEDKVPGAAGTTVANERLGIASIVVADGPAGLRITPKRANDKNTYYATAFPIATLLASSWDTDLVYATGVAMGNEVKEYGVDIILGPGMNIHRNALGGRNFEYYSEDPLLSGKMASAMVNGIQSNGVGTSVKHFAVNNHETNRNTINVKVGERALREIYLRGFEIVIKESDPWTVMSSYNKINGPYTSESHDLLTKILREDWGYKGFVMTDWFGGSNAVAQMNAGNNLLMPGNPKQVEEIIEGVKTGKLKEEVLDTNVDEMLNIIRKTSSYKKYKASNKPNLRENAVVGRNAAAEGMILLKNNDKALPLKEGNSIAVFGNYSYDLVSGGTGSGDVNEAYTVSLTEGLKNLKFDFDTKLATTYNNYLEEEKAKQPKREGFAMFLKAPVITEMKLEQEKVDAATANDVAVITIGRVSGEFADRKKVNDYYLSPEETKLIDQVSTAFHAKGKKVVVLLNVGGLIETVSWRDKVDGILLTWLPGQEAGNAIADILSGTVNPSGKLPTTFSEKYEDDPTSVGFPGREYGDLIDMGFQKVRLAEIEYKEGIYVGYRNFEKNKIEAAYEFGYGMSYTKFTYSDIKLSSSNFKETIEVSVSITNTGSVAGKEVVQLYLSAPGKTMDKPSKELKGFAKTKLLQPNESELVTFVLNARSLTSFDTARTAWVAEKGDYQVRIGASSQNIKLKTTFKLKEENLVEGVNKALVSE